MLGIFLLTVPLGVVGAAMAWLISYDELSRHYASRRDAAAEASKRAVAVLVFFVVLGAAVAAVAGGHA